MAMAVKVLMCGPASNILYHPWRWTPGTGWTPTKATDIRRQPQCCSHDHWQTATLFRPLIRTISPPRSANIQLDIGGLPGRRKTTHTTPHGTRRSVSDPRGSWLVILLWNFHPAQGLFDEWNGARGAKGARRERLLRWPPPSTVLCLFSPRTQTATRVHRAWHCSPLIGGRHGGRAVLERLPRSRAHLPRPGRSGAHLPDLAQGAHRQLRGHSPRCQG